VIERFELPARMASVGLPAESCQSTRRSGAEGWVAVADEV